MAQISRRKQQHLDLAATGDVAFKHKTTLLECVHLVHNALPELQLSQIDCSTRVLGHRLAAPLLVAGMTGGTPEAGEINRGLARIAQRRGYAFGLGSQRALLDQPELIETYRVRDEAPGVLLLGNLGLVQAAQLDTERIRTLIKDVDANALCIHLNPAMELVQPEGDQDFRGGLSLFRRLVTELDVPVVAKETGCGLSKRVGLALREAGVRHADVSGAGGTSWVAVETQRSAPEQRGLGELFWDWGIPTAASVGMLAPLGFKTLFATGGIHNGLQAARALALGASSVGIARPVLQHWRKGGEQAAERFLLGVERELVVCMALVGATSLDQLRSAPRVIDPELQRWLEL